MAHTHSNLVKLQADQTGDKRGRGSNGRNNLTGNLLRRVPISDRYIIIHGSKVRRCSNKVDMMIGIVILFEFNWSKSVSSKRGWWRQLLRELGKVIYFSSNPVILPLVK
jgi:hypothetical protein